MCECVKSTNEAMQSQERMKGFRLCVFYSTNGGSTKPMITTYFSGDKKPRGVSAPSFVPQFCPFCGTKYDG